MTAAGKAQVSAAQAIGPACAALAKVLKKSRGGPAEHALAAECLHGCLGSLASAVNNTGYDAAGQWGYEFLDGQAADPDWLHRSVYAAAGRIQTGANVTIAIRAVPLSGADMTRPVAQAGHAAGKACHDFGELICEQHRAGVRPQVPEFASILSALHAACEPLAVSVAVIAPRLASIEPDPSSVWCEGFGGDLAGAYRDAAGHCRAGGQVLRPVCGQVAADVRAWRSRSRPRPGVT